MIDIGTVIQDVSEDLQDIGLVTEIRGVEWHHPLYTIFWVCARPEGKDYTTSLYYTEDELKGWFDSGHFEVVG